MVTPEDALAAYEATLPRLESARVEHDAAYADSLIKYRTWLAACKAAEPKEGHEA